MYGETKSLELQKFVKNFPYCLGKRKKVSDTNIVTGNMVNYSTLLMASFKMMMRFEC